MGPFLFGLLAFSLPLLIAVSDAGAAGSGISGVIEITHRLTKQPVAPAAAAYRRGMVVPLPNSTKDFVDTEMERVAVYLESEQPLPSAEVTAVLNQKDRRFVQETVVIPAGSSVSFPNLDPIFHNVFSLSRAKTFDLGNYPQNDTRVVQFPKPGIVRIYCHLHPNMSASIVVAPNRWCAKPDKEGRYKLTDIPEGEHAVVVWHKSAGFFRQRIRLTAGKSARVDFTIPIENGARVITEQ
jgi:plastocyanin